VFSEEQALPARINPHARNPNRRRNEATLVYMVTSNIPFTLHFALAHLGASVFQ
jgi:hypothetical protein